MTPKMMSMGMTNQMRKSKRSFEIRNGRNGKEGATVINRASEGTCRQCGRRILWVRMKSGKNMPVDMVLHNYKKDSAGKEKIVTPDGEVVTGRILIGERGDGAGYISHFASCKKYRR